MVNGYVNIPAELSDLDQFREAKKIPGIYNKMNAVLDINKPAVGTFTYGGITAVFAPSVYPYLGKIVLNFKLGVIEISLTIDIQDTVKID